MLQVRDFVAARLYESEEEVIQDALRHLLRARPELLLQLDVHRSNRGNPPGQGRRLRWSILSADARHLVGTRRFNPD